MKKFLIILAMAAISMPAMAVCSIDGTACTADLPQTPSIQQKYIPNHLDDMQKTDAFQQQYRQPYNDELINTEAGTATTPESPNYNSNCQFGVCLPSVQPGVGGVE